MARPREMPPERRQNGKAAAEETDWGDGNAVPGPAWPEPLGPPPFTGSRARSSSLDPLTEADPAAMLVQLLVAIGNAVGRHAIASSAIPSITPTCSP